jgi:hypothetical protein
MEESYRSRELTVHLGAVTVPDTVENYVIESVGHRMASS